MPRKKKVEAPVAERFVFCDSGKAHCTRTDCMRHFSHAEYNVPVYRRAFEPNSDTKCDWYISQEDMENG